jgi:hypothetical protein
VVPVSTVAFFDRQHEASAVLATVIGRFVQRVWGE